MEKFKIDLKLLGDLFVLAGAGLSVYYILNTILNDHLDNTVKNKENEKKGSGILKENSSQSSFKELVI